jgi:phosphoribosylformylglycinamidine cyclo-ligase
VLVAMASSGLHSNGYSLVRRVLAVSRTGLEDQVDELGRTVGEELLEPTRVYARDVLDLVRAGRDDGVDVHAVSHVTGGGLAANLARVLPRGLEAVVDRSTWTPAPVFGWVRRLGEVPIDDLERTLNLGVGMIAVMSPDGVDAALARLRARGLPSWVLGEVTTADGRRTDGDVTQGAKGVDGGAVRMIGSQPI